MIIKYLRSLAVVFFVLVFLPVSVFGFTPDKSAEETVQESIAEIFKVIQKYGRKDNSDQYLKEMEKLMDQKIGYKVIARRVMDEYFVEATREQKIRFLEALEKSLLNTYAIGLNSFDGFDARVVEGKGDQDSFKNTQVFVEIQSPEGNNFPMMQSMYYSQSAEAWLIQNVVFNGVNLGITFRNQFERVMTQAGGDIDKAIDLWVENTQKAYDQANYRNPSAELLKESAEE